MILKVFSAFEFFKQQLYFIFLRLNSFETIKMKLYFLVPTETSLKLDIFEIQYNTQLLNNPGHLITPEVGDRKGRPSKRS
jgi:hypothetical protein